MIVIVLALLGPALAVVGLVVQAPALRCECTECAAWRRWGWRAIASGLALVVAAWLISP